MDGYELHFEEASQCATQLEKLIEDLKTQIDALKTTETEVLNEQNWNGPNRRKYMTEHFAEYEQAINSLYESAVEHHSKLVEILNAYQAVEA